jgi:RHS repeat-associated protein
MCTHALNQLTTLSRTGKASRSFAYDYSGRRVRKTTAAFNAAPQLTTDYLYNGEHIYAEYQTSAFTTASAVNNHGAGDDEILSRTTVAGASSETTYLHQDHILSVALQTNATGVPLDIAKAGRIHDAWGNVSQQSPSAGTANAITNAFGYTGREPEEAGLIYYRARYYDPSIGRFTQQDPIGLRGGINTFAYVNGNPLSLIDPSGNLASGATGNGLNGTDDDIDCPKSDRAKAGVNITCGRCGDNGPLGCTMTVEGQPKQTLNFFANNNVQASIPAGTSTLTANQGSAHANITNVGNPGFVNNGINLMERIQLHNTSITGESRGRVIPWDSPTQSSIETTNKIIDTIVFKGSGAATLTIFQFDCKK